jgi:hypothetical protein
MNDHEDTAANAFAQLLAAEDANRAATESGEEADARCHALIAHRRVIELLKPIGPWAAFAKIYVTLTEAATACPEDESGINFEDMRAILSEHLRPASMTIPNGLGGAPLNA